MAPVGLFCMIGCGWMTLYAAFCWKSFLWSLLFCTVHCGFCCLVSDPLEKKIKYKSEAADVSAGMGVICTYLAVFLLLLPETGLSLFPVIFNIGAISMIGSVLFLLVEKQFDEGIQSAASAARDALTQSNTLVKVLATVVLTFICATAACIFPPPNEEPVIYIDKSEIMKTKEEKKQLAKRLDRVKDVGQGITLSTRIDALIWGSGLIPRILHSWYADVRKFAALFILGAGCTITGVWLRGMEAFGLTPFVVGNVCIMSSIFCLKDLKTQLELTCMMFDEGRVCAAVWMIISFVLTLLTIFWWDSFVVASFFCVLYISTTFWYSLSYITFGRIAVKKVWSIYFPGPVNLLHQNAEKVNK